MNLFSLGGFFTESVAETWMSLWLSLNSMVYKLISVLYELFTAVANVNLFSDAVFEKITGRLYIVMGIAMLFIFAYNIILMIINPDDKKTAGNNSKLVKETIISLVLIILLPTIFRYMSTFQYNVLNSGIIGQIILGDTTNEDDCDYSDMDLLNTYIPEEKEKISLGSFCVKDAAIMGTIGGAWGTAFTPVGTGVGLAGGAAIGCVGGLVRGSIEKIKNYFGRGTKITDGLSTYCDLYNSLSDADKGARIVAPTIFSAFYRPTMFDYNDCVNYLKTCGSDNNCNYTFDEGNTSTEDTKNGKIDTEDEKKICAFYVYDVDVAKYTGDMAIFNEDSEFINRVKGDEEIFEFNYFLAFLAGCLAFWMFFCYTYAIGKRVAKLGFLQIISPVTVMLRIVPKQKEAVFDKWLKELLNTYLDVFIRLAIIYFCLFGVSLVPNIMENLFNSTSGIIGGLACVVVILGILQFAQEAPELFKQFFGASGNFALKSPKKQFNENKLAKGALGWAGGSLLGLGSGIAQKNAGKAIGGLIRGGKNAARNMYNADITKKGTLTDTFKNSKYQTDYEQNHTKFKAIKSGIKSSGGIKKYAEGEYKSFMEFLADSNQQSEKYGAANKLFTDSASFNDVVINGIIKDETTTKGLWAENKDLMLGNSHYTFNRGKWTSEDGKEYSKSDMKKRMDEYFVETKANEMAKRLNNSDDKVIRDSLKSWSEDFNKTLREELPKLGNNVGEGFFKTINENGGLGVEVNSIEEVIKRMDELQKLGLEGNNKAFEDWSKTKIAMDKGFKDIKDGQYQDMHGKKDK